MKLWTLITSSVVSLLILSGCGATPKPKEEVAIDPTLQTIELTESGVFIDINAIAFEWKNITDERVKGIYIYKHTANKEGTDSGLTYYKTIENRFTTHYLDADIKPNSSYSYSFKTFTKDTESKMSKIKTLKSLPILKSVVWIKSIQNMPRSAKIIWRPHTNKKVKAYFVERRTLKDNEWDRIARVDGRLNAEFIDLDLKDNFVYKYRVRVLTYDDITSYPSEIVQVITKALPNNITNIVATTNLPRKINIIWKKSDNKDFDIYYLYRAEESDGSYELIAKLHNNKFTDKIEEDGKEYFYRVSAVVKNGLESIYDKLSIQGITLNKTEAPSLVEAKLVGNTIKLSWSNKDPRVEKFAIVKKSKSGWFEVREEEFTGIKSNSFTDSEIGPETSYRYQIYSFDKNSIKSHPSIEVEIETPSSVANNRKVQKKKTTKRVPKSSKKSTIKNEEVVIPVQDFN